VRNAASDSGRGGALAVGMGGLKGGGRGGSVCAQHVKSTGPTLLSFYVRAAAN
jgi:hypothetical protein